MAEAISVSRPISGTEKTLTFETGKLAAQAGGAVVGRIGDTVVLLTATGARKGREGQDFFPLTVDIEERMYAAGRSRARSSVARASRATTRSLRRVSSTGRSDRTSPTGTATRCTSWARCSAPTRRTPTTSSRSTRHRRHCACRMSRSCARSARCASPTRPTVCGSRSRPSRKARSRPSRWSSPGASSTTATSRS